MQLGSKGVPAVDARVQRLRHVDQDVPVVLHAQDVHVTGDEPGQRKVTALIAANCVDPWPQRQGMELLLVVAGTMHLHAAGHVEQARMPAAFGIVSGRDAHEDVPSSVSTCSHRAPASPTFPERFGDMVRTS
jgi:hypothetical protein